MPILQNKLVMKSIEALHDEALALMPNTPNKRGVATPPTVLHAATSPHEPPVDALKGISSDALPESVGDQDIIARIDHLLKKIDENDDVAITPLADEWPKSDVGNMSSDGGHTATTDNRAIEKPANTNNYISSTSANHANKNTIVNEVLGSIVEDAEDKPLGDNIDDINNYVSNNTADDANNDMLAVDQPGKNSPSDQTQAMAAIATAIYQARQQAVETVVADSSQNNAAPLDIDTLSATIADEVRRTVSAVMIAELPQMVRDTVDEVIRTLPADARHLSTPTTNNPSTAKSVTARKTAAIKKAVAKKAATKKAPGKRALKKKPNIQKARQKKTPPSA